MKDAVLFMAKNNLFACYLEVRFKYQVQTIFKLFKN